MMLTQFLVSFIATSAFAVLFYAPRRCCLFCGMVGSLAWISYRAVSMISGSEALGCFVAALMLALLARFASILLETPTIVFLIPGILPLVPGAGIYYTAFHLFYGEGEKAFSQGLETLAVSGAISLGMLLAFFFPQALFDHFYQFKRKVKGEGTGTY